MATTQNGLNDLTWDSSACASVVLGSTRVAFTKFAPPKVETKTEKVARIAEQRATRRTPGRTEIADMSAEMLATDFEFKLLPAFNRHGSNLVEFETIVDIRHPSISGSFGLLLTACRIVSEEGPELAADEKGLIYKLGISVMQVWRRGRDGIWKCHSYERALPSSQAAALMQF
jgi:hypothetical protein